MQRRHLTQEELFFATRQAPLRERLIVAILFETGCALNELVALRIKNLSLGNRKNPRFAIGAPSRRVTVSFELQSLLKEWLVRHPRRASPSAPLFLSRQGPITTRRVEQLLAQIGPKGRNHRRLIDTPRLTPRLIRSSAIINDLLSGATPAAIERKTGLKSIQNHIYAYHASRQRWGS